MRTSSKLSLYGAALAVVFAGALGAGEIAGPIDVGGDGGHDDVHETDRSGVPSTTDASVATHDQDDGHEGR